jgi:transcriptional accessory protein Tex/SPT6
MLDPGTLAAGAIAKLAFDEFVKAGAGETAKKTVEVASNLVKSLRDKIRAKFQGDQKAETALAQVEQHGSPAALTKLEVYLDDAMAEDPTFADDIRQVAQQIIAIESQTIEGNRTYNQTAGRDIFNVEKIEGGSNKFGGS